MNPAHIPAIAHYLIEAKGAKALAEAAQKAASFERAGAQNEAKFWQRAEAVASEMHGPKES